MSVRRFEREINGGNLIIESGKLAGQANGSVTVQYGGTVVLATATMSNNAREGIDFFPLMVDYEERLYAAGKIKGSRFIKREGRPSEEAILSGRIVDRTIRPLFNGRIRNEVQVVITILSLDQENDPDFCSVIGASAALAISDIPWNGPVGAIRIARVGSEIVVNPSYREREAGEYELFVTGKDGKINMIEAGGKEIPEKEAIAALALAQKYIEEVSAFQKEIIAAIGKEKKAIKLMQAPDETESKMREFLSGKMEGSLVEKDKQTRMKNVENLKEEYKKFVSENLGEEFLEISKLVMEEELDGFVHKLATERGERVDGRKMDQVREISAEVGILPRTHGSAIFNRGETQALTVLTLGSPGDEQILDGMTEETESTKRFMHHYSFPPYSVGEVKPMRGPGRREIGHGALAEKAIEPLIPAKEDFPYTIRLVSEILSSNGSSSQASVCGSALALMDGGVPIPRMAAGIAMGLMSDKNGNYKVLTDIQGPEDHYGDMDFKVAGTEKGITAIQMDVKIDGIDLKVLEEAIARARDARMHIIGIMNSAIAAPREDLSMYAPRITSFRINPDKIRDVIGPGGKIINEIIADTGVNIDIEDDGLVMITSKSAEASSKATAWIKNITREVVPGEVFQGKVVKIMTFGAFVEILPGQEGLVHISELAPARVEKVEDVVKTGDIIAVKVKNIDEQGRINLTHKGI
ncbi:MAG: polyribonucleotide nucleotidyltransferase [Candidatus Pacebacteria bacterium]|nr:polyribonucleotide nucleotidyltransferase [Candidatus Paceibacterota bacterium]